MFAYKYPSTADDLEAEAINTANDDCGPADRGIQRDEGVSSTATEFGESCKSLFHWKNSFFQLIWKQALLYYLVYVAVTLIYNFVLTDRHQKENFEALAREVGKYTTSLPVVLLLGFFTSSALNRWFLITNNMPGTSRPISAFIVSLQAETPDGTERVDRYARYVLLLWLLTFRNVSKSLRNKYPNLLAIQKSGFLMESERRVLEWHKMTNPSGRITLPLLVFDWLNILIKDTARKGYFSVPADTGRNVDQVQLLKKNCGGILKFATKNIPVSLIQAVTIAIHCHGLFSIISHTVRPDSNEDTRFLMTLLTGYIPIPYALTYFFYYAWLKVGRIATDPFGEDQDDIDVLNLFQLHVDDAVRLRRTYQQTLETLFNKDLILI